ncbi:MAG: hypothetical protein ABI967_15300 [bacterium]
MNNPEDWLALVVRQPGAACPQFDRKVAGSIPAAGTTSNVNYLFANLRYTTPGKYLATERMKFKPVS